MSFGRWVLGAAAAGLALGAVSAQAAPLPFSPIDGRVSAQTVQFFYDDDPPPPVYYDAPPPRYYRNYPPPPPRGYYPPPPRAYYAPPPGRYGPPPPRYGNNNRGRPPEYYTKGEVRAWNRANGF